MTPPTCGRPLRSMNETEGLGDVAAALGSDVATFVRRVVRDLAFEPK